MGSHFTILGNIDAIQVIASGRGIRERRRLQKVHGGQRWRKMKGFALVRLADGCIVRAEIHWYEAAGVGRKEIKIKRFLRRS